MDLNTSTATDGSGVADAHPGDLSDLRRPSLRVRGLNRVRSSARRVGDMGRGRQIGVATLIVGAGIAAKYGPRAVARLQGRNKASGLGRLRFWRR